MVGSASARPGLKAETRFRSMEARRGVELSPDWTGHGEREPAELRAHRSA